MKKRTKTTLPEPRCALPGLMDFIKGTDEDQGQRAFETAMGMRGYAGSAAEKEDRLPLAGRWCNCGRRWPCECGEGVFKDTRGED